MTKTVASTYTDSIQVPLGVGVCPCFCEKASKLYNRVALRDRVASVPCRRLLHDWKNHPRSDDLEPGQL